ncbi:MAG: ribonuclease Z [Marinifilaceae bacterium]
MKFELTILGCGSAIPTLTRNATAQVLNVLERYFLIDCGEGTQHQLRKYKIPYNKINHIFISHLHGDHFFGLIGFLSTLSMQGRRGDMHIYADRRLQELFDFQIKLLKCQMNFPIIYHHLQKGEQLIYDDAVLTVTSFPVKHRYDAPCWGFLFKEKERPRAIRKDMTDAWGVPLAFMQYLKQGEDYTTPDGQLVSNTLLTQAPSPPRSYAFITDTLYRERFADYIHGVDLLYHEATYGSESEKLAKATCHSTAAQAAQMAIAAGAKQLIIGHYSARYTDILPLLEEAQKLFLDTSLADEGKVFKVELVRE